MVSYHDSKLRKENPTQDQCDAPRNLGWRLVKFFGKLLDGQRYCEEIKGVPCPGEEGDQEKQPLVKVQQSYQLQGIRSLGHGWFQSGEPSGEVCAHAHMLGMVDPRGIMA